MILESRVDVPIPVDAAWEWFQDLSHWDFFFDSFYGKHDFFRHQTQSVEGKPNQVRVLLADRTGKKHALWDVIEWRRPNRMAFTGKQTGENEVLLQMAVDLEPVPEAPKPSTRIRIRLDMLFKSRLLKMLCALPPVKYIYRWQFARALQAVKFSIV